MSERPRPTTRSDYRAFYPIQTRWSDNDIYGHLNNTVYYALFDTAMNGWLIEQGLLDPTTSGQIGIVAESGCRFFAETHFPENLVAGLRVEHLGTSSVRYGLALFREGREEALAAGFFVHVFVDRVSRKPLPIGDLYRRAFTNLAVDAAA